MIIGIDLGTTNSLVAVWESGEVKMIPNALGKFLTPSVISIDDDAIIIGEPAVDRLITHPTLTIANFKRFMGTDKIFKLGSHSFRSEELSALILKKLKDDAEFFLKKPVTEAVITVPAYFSDAQRKATKIAGKLAGLKVERLINEPTAAGIAYGLQNQLDDTNYLIFDLGGGTFDVSLLTIFSGIIEVRASNGDNFLGGIDFTKILEEIFIKKIQKDEKVKISLALQNKIREQAEITKRQLSSESSVAMRVSSNAKIYEASITHQEFEDALDLLLQRLREPIKKVLRDAKLTSSEIQNIILVGGASRMPVIKRLVARMLGKLPLSHVDPDMVVAQGAAIQAGLKAGDMALDEIVVTDVCPYSLGIALYSQRGAYEPGIVHFDPIIERNSVIPTSRSRIYSPVHENQEQVAIKIYQGESFQLDQNVFLGVLTIPMPKNIKQRAIEVRFTYDINGLLEVETTVLETQEKNSLIIENNPGVMTENEIKERLQVLKDIKIHPRERMENLLLISSAERLYEEVRNEKREYLANQIKELMRELETQDPVKISRMHAKLTKTLDEIRQEIKFT